jgi:hypothetical protein
MPRQGRLLGKFNFDWDTLAAVIGGQSELHIGGLSPDIINFQIDIGLPIHPVTNLPHALLSHQVTYLKEAVRHRDIVGNKANKIGFSEAVLREMIWRGVKGDCRGYLLMLGAQDMRLAADNMRRLQAVFLRSPDLASLVQKEGMTRNHLYLVDGTRYMVMPRRASAIRGWERLKFAFMDEAAHYGLLDDEEFLAATSSRLANTDGYLRVVSTPKGQRGFFYRACMDADSNPHTPWKKFQWDYHVGLGAMFTEEFIERERIKLGPLFPQEYECAFLAAQSAAYPAGLIDSARKDYEVVEE